jgi:hypothetical protein
VAAVEVAIVTRRAPQAEALRQAILQRILESRRGLSLKQIGRTLGIGPQDALPALRVLQAAGKVELFGDKAGTRWRAERLLQLVSPEPDLDEAELLFQIEEEEEEPQSKEVRPFPGLRTFKVEDRKRAKTIECRRTPRWRLELERALRGGIEHPRPRTRADCARIERPCPYVGCRHNLYLDVNPATGSIKLNFPWLEPDQMDPRASCSLDAAEWGGWTLEEIGYAMNLTRERVRQLERKGLRNLKRRVQVPGGRDLGAWRQP